MTVKQRSFDNPIIQKDGTKTRPLCVSTYQDSIHHKKKVTNEHVSSGVRHSLKMSLTNNTFLNDRLRKVHSENLNKLVEALIKYDEMESLFTSAGQDTTQLKDAIKSTLQASMILIAVTQDTMLKFTAEQEAEALR